MAMNGFALGGAWQGINQATQTGIEQQRNDITQKLGEGKLAFMQKDLALKQEQMKNEENRSLYARADQNRKEIMGLVQQTIAAAQTQAAISGTPFDVNSFSQKLMPMVKAAARLADSSGAPGGSGQVLSEFSLMLSGLNNQNQGKTAPKAAPSSGAAPPAQAASPSAPKIDDNLGDITGVQYSDSGSTAPPAQPSPMSAQQKIAAITTALGNPGLTSGQRSLLEFQLKQVSGSIDPLKQAQTQAAQARAKLEQNQAADIAQLRKPVDLSKVDPLQKFQAEQILEGNTSVLAGTGFSQAAGTYRLQTARIAAALGLQKGMTPKQANDKIAAFMGQKAGARVISTIEAKTITAANKAAFTAPRVLEAASEVDRTKYPSLNSLIVAYNKGTGDPREVRLAIALNTFMNNYALAQGNGNAQITDSARKEAFSLLSAAWAHGQVKAAVEQMLHKELPSEVFGSGQSLQSFFSPPSSLAEAEKNSYTQGKPYTNSKKGPPGKLPPPPPGAIIMQ